MKIFIYYIIKNIESRSTYLNTISKKLYKSHIEVKYTKSILFFRSNKISRNRTRAFSSIYRKRRWHSCRCSVFDHTDYNTRTYTQYTSFPCSNVHMAVV